MDAIESLGEAVHQIEKLLEHQDLAPGNRGKGQQGSGQRAYLAELIRDRLLRRVEGALQQAGTDDGVRRAIRQRVAQVLGDAASAAGDAGRADDWLKEASGISPEEPQRGALDAARREVAAWDLFCAGRYHARQGQAFRARWCFRRAAARAKDPSLKALAARSLDAPIAVRSAPSLALLNGIGTTLYGRRDEQPDGSYIATFFFCVFFVPVFPMTAYRVAPGQEGGYYFLSEERLGPVARAWQALAASSLVAVVVGALVAGAINSPSRKVYAELAEAKRLEATGDQEGALARYAGLIEAHPRGVDLSTAVEGYLRISSRKIADPCVPEQVDLIGRVVHGYQGIPEAQRGKRGAPLVARLRACASQLEAGAPRASLVVLEMAREVASEGEERRAVDAQSLPLRQRFAAAIARTRPADALVHYARVLDNEGARQAASALIDGLGPAQISEVSDAVDAAAQAEERAGRPLVAARHRARVKEAHEARLRSEAVVESGDEARLTEALRRSPGDEVLAQAAASQARRRGDSAACVAALAGPGQPGSLTAEGQVLLAACHAEAGALEQARGILEPLLEERRPAFLEAQRALRLAAARFEEKIEERAREGDLPDDLSKKLQAASEAERPQIFGEWARDQSKGDPELKRCREAAERHSPAVAASLELGSVCLQQAARAAGDQRARHLAAAEQAYLSFRAETEGAASFHLGLGEVYHRLGKPQQGDEELSKLLARNEPAVTLGVASTYRGLGLDPQARSAAQSVYESKAPQELRDSAAMLLAQMSHILEEKRAWLDRIASSNEHLALEKDDLKAQIALRDGRLDEADRGFALVVAAHERNAESSPAEANNTAVLYQRRFLASGDVAHLKSSINWIEKSALRSPGNAIIQGNLSAALEHAGLVQVLERWVKVRALTLYDHEAHDIVQSMLASPLKAELQQAMARDPLLRRSLDAARRKQLLAPGDRSAYEGPLRWAHWSDDTRGLAALRSQLEALPALAQDAEMLERYRSGALDEARSKSFEGQIKASQLRLERAQKTGHEPTIAAAWMLLSSAIDRKIQGSGRVDPGQLDTALEAARQAARRWPEAFKADLEASLFVHATLSAADKLPALRAAWEADFRELHPVDVAFLTAPGADVAAALQQQPTFAEALKLAEERPDGSLGFLQWQAARLAGRPALERRSAEAIRRQADAHAIEQLISPASRRITHQKALMKQVAPP